MTWQSAAPTAVANLVSIWGTAVGDTEVRDGPVINAARLTEVVVVGYYDDHYTEAIEHHFDPDGTPTLDQFVINCQITTVSGTTGNIAATRARAYELLAACGAAISPPDHTLNGAVMRARIVNAQFSQEQARNGQIAKLRFAVACDAYAQ